ncbi:MAG: hypothetical protein ACE144_05395 [Thermodesulfobacteriota bacterium]
MLIKELMEGVRNFVDWCDIQTGDKIMIVSPTIPPVPEEDVIRALTIAVEESGAIAYELRTRPYDMLRGGAVPDYVNEAAKGCNMFLTLTPVEEGNVEVSGMMGVGYGGIRGLKKFCFQYAVVWHQTRTITVQDMSDFHARYPQELLREISRHVIRRFIKGKTCRVTTPSGTDVTMGLHPDYIEANAIRERRPGGWMGGGFPGAIYGHVPWKPYNGRIVVDAFMPQWNPPEVYLKPGDAVITVENDRATTTSGIYGDWITNILDKDKNGRWGAECMFGVHPHAWPKPWQSPVQWFMDLHDRAVALHLAFGNCIGGGGPYYSTVHLDVYTYYPTVYVDGEKVVDAGHLTVLDDPSLREFAKQFGDPDFLLTERPLPTVVDNLIKR